MAPAKKAASKKATAKKSSKKATNKKASAKKTASKKGTAKKSGKKSSKKSAKKTAKRAASKAASLSNVVVASKVKDAIKSADVRMSSDFPEALNAEVQELIDKAAQRAKDNGRSTVRPSDL
jgi:histone H3/H4